MYACESDVHIVYTHRAATVQMLCSIITEGHLAFSTQGGLNGYAAQHQEMRPVLCKQGPADEALTGVYACQLMALTALLLVQHSPGSGINVL